MYLWFLHLFLQKPNVSTLDVPADSEHSKPLPCKSHVLETEPLEPPVPELIGQLVQVAAPVEVLYVFAEHAVGVPPFGPV